MVFYGINDLSDMERNRWVDDFVDCVIRRSETDSVPSTYLVVLVIIVPLILAQAFIASGVTALGDWFDGNEYEVVYYVSLYAECCIVSFVLFVLTRRSSSHLARDIVWMDSLIGYAESKGADASTLRGIRDEASRGRWTAKGWVGTAFWLAVTAYTIIQGFILFYGTGPEDGRGLVPFVYVYLLVMAQFVFTLGTTAGFPYRHDRLQCEFSREFSERAAGFGLEIDAMEPSVRFACLDFAKGIPADFPFEIVFNLDCRKGRFSVDDQGNDPLTGVGKPFDGFNRIAQGIVEQGIGVIMAHETNCRAVGKNGQLYAFLLTKKTCLVKDHIQGFVACLEAVVIEG